MEKNIGNEKILMKAIVEKNADGLLVIGRDGNVVFANPAALSLFDLKRKAITGKPFQYPVEAGKTTEVDVERKDGKKITVEMRTADIDWGGDKAVGNKRAQTG